MTVKNSRTVTKVRSGKCFICDTRAAFKDVEVVDGADTTTWWCKDHAEQDVINLANSGTVANTNSTKSTTAPKKETTMVATKNTPARKKAPAKPAATPAMATKATPRRRAAAKPATKDTAPAPAADAPKRRRRPVKPEPVAAKPATKPTARRGKPAAAKETKPAPAGDVAYVLASEVDGQVVYVSGLSKKDSAIQMSLDAKHAVTRKSAKSLVGYWTKTAAAAHLNPGVLLNPFNEDDETDYVVMVYTIRNGRRSTRKDDAPVSLASVAND